MAPKKPTAKEKLGKLKRVSSKKLDGAKKQVKDYSNINRYNKYLFMLETLLLVGVIDEYLETLVLQLDYGIYLNVLLLMGAIGIVFTFALALIEPIARGSIIWLVRLNNNKILRLAVHIIILGFIYYLYAGVFFDVTVGLNVDIGLEAA